MQDDELAEIKKRAEIICARAIESLQSELTALHRRNAAKGQLRSGGTVKESSTIARKLIQSYFSELEQFVRSRPDGRAGFDASIIDVVSSSTDTLIKSIDEVLLKTAILAGDPKYVNAIQPEIAAELSASQETFRSNIRAYCASKASSNVLSSTGKALLGIEAFCLVASCIIIGMWINDPKGSYEPFLALFGAGGVATDIYRRFACGHAP